MRRALILLLLPASILAALGTDAAATTAPIVSPKAFPYYRYDGLRGTRGFEKVKPGEIYYGGDPTGLVCRIHWHTWGGRVARGTGVGWYISGNQSVNEGHTAVATVVASKLGTWEGRPAYNRLTWSFPNHGRDHAPSC